MLNRNGTTAEAILTNGIRIDVEIDLDDLLDNWAEKESRSKREHVCHIVRELASAYTQDPLILHRIALVRAGAARFVVA